MQKLTKTILGLSLAFAGPRAFISSNNDMPTCGIMLPVK